MTEYSTRGGFDELVARSRVVVCTGTGGVGKTSAAAALALHAANAGRKAVVVTVDPAKRLADALGLAQLTNEPHEIKGIGREDGSLHALMLDTRATFDGLVTRYSKDREQAERILANRFYQNIAGSLSGTDEYMAMEKLHDLHESQRFDLIVVDTPPTRNALAFLDAPGLLTRLLENRVYRILVTPTRGLARTATSAAHLVVRHLTKVVGSDVVDDAIAFFRAFDGMESGFERRANSVLELLRSDDTSFVLVASPRADTIDEARYFATQLAVANIAVRGLLVNRVTPTFDGAVADGDSPAARALADFRSLAAREAGHVESLRLAVPGVPLVEVPILPFDIHDLDGLETLARFIVGADGSAK
jgi:anion-transporting  ArsA/GET3 family ATPase